MMADTLDRQTGATRNEPLRRQDFEREDTRWEKAGTTRDWVILLIAITLHTAWMLVVFFLEPGIR